MKTLISFKINSIHYSEMMDIEYILGDSEDENVRTTLHTTMNPPQDTETWAEMKQRAEDKVKEVEGI